MGSGEEEVAATDDESNNLCLFISGNKKLCLGQMDKVVVALATVVIAFAVVAVTVPTLAIILVVDCCLPLPLDEDNHLPLGGEGLHKDNGCLRHRRRRAITAALLPRCPPQLPC